ncbi:putative protein S-acyltransferase 9 [Sesamum angolense]|uniref:S-acyltransferase n=1 Tax=Sesamum angolense TaxID=2727404 RepID=A0AAE2BMK2_9LAMI|nr:putative protein S-acyltransferase 9 [Sesamum angolense]
MTLQHQWRLADGKRQASSSPELKKSWLMGSKLGLNIAILVCYIVLLVARIAPSATIAWSVLIITALGWRNYRYFFCFVSSATLLCIYVFAISAFYIKVLMDDHHGTVWKAMKESPASVILMAYCFISLWFVGGLTGFHLYLISTNQTTYENFRYRSDNRINVYDRGCLNNFFEVFCTKVKPSRNNFRAFAQDEPQRPPIPTSRDAETEDAGDDRRMKVEDDLDIGGDLLKISQRHNIEDIEADIRSRGSDVPHHNSSEADSVLGSDRRGPAVQSETRHSSWGRSGSWEIANEASYVAQKEAYQ